MKLVTNAFNNKDGKRQDIVEAVHKRRFGKSREWAVLVEFATGKRAYIPLPVLENMAIRKIDTRKIPTF